uniref:Uncharacterized protein n=1 Tax=Glossina pallidipes TaxID=7398 RepID=A0A1B0A0A0_GLOPL
MFLTLITLIQVFKAVIGRLSSAPYVCLMPRTALPGRFTRPFLRFVKTLYYNHPRTRPRITPRLETKCKIDYSTKQAGITKSPFKTFTSNSGMDSKELIAFYPVAIDLEAEINYSEQ